MKRIFFLASLLLLNGCEPHVSKQVLANRMYLVDRLPNDLKFSPRIASSKTDNGYELLVVASQAIPKTFDSKEFNKLRNSSISAKTLGDFKLFISNFEPAMQLLAKASECKFLTTTFNASTMYKELTSTKNLTKILLLRARLNVYCGKHREALHDIVVASKICEKLLNGESSVIHYLVSCALCSVLGVELMQIAWMPQATRNFVHSMLGLLPKRPDGTQIGRHYLSELCTFQLPSIREYEHLIRNLGSAPDESSDILGAAAVALKGHPAPYDQAKTSEILFRLARQVLSNCKGRWVDRVDIESEVAAYESVWPVSLYESEYTDFISGTKPSAIPTEVINEARVKVSKASNPYGKLIVFSLMQSFASLEQADFLARVRNDAVRISLANRLYSFDHGGNIAPKL